VAWLALGLVGEEGDGGSVLFVLQARRKEEEEMNGGGGSGSRGALHALGSWPHRQVARGAWRTRGGVFLLRRHVPFTELLNRGFSSVKASLTEQLCHSISPKPVRVRRR
jgi:hypothetical protein